MENETDEITRLRCFPRLSPLESSNKGGCIATSTNLATQMANKYSRRENSTLYIDYLEMESTVTFFSVSSVHKNTLLDIHSIQSYIILPILLVLETNHMYYRTT